MIGYKMWAALTARVLTHFGIVTVVADYRNNPFFMFQSSCCPAGGCGGCCCWYPQIPDMVRDVSIAIQWTVDHVADYGGDPQRIVLVGQSAGGHLLTTALLQKAIMEQSLSSPMDDQNEQVTSPSLHTQQPVTERSAPPAHEQFQEQQLVTIARNDDDDDDRENPRIHRREWLPTDMCGLVSVSAPYNFDMMTRTFRRHGLDPHVVWKGMFQRNQQNPNDYDPLHLVQQRLARYRQDTTLSQHSDRYSEDSPGLHLPRMELWHGLRDKTVPWESAQLFGEALAELQSHSQSTRQSVQYRLFETWTHTDAILESPLSGCHEFHKELFHLVHEWTMTHEEDVGVFPHWQDDHGVLKPMWCPTCLAQLGRFFIPF